MTQIETAQALARSNIAKAQQLMKLKYDKKAADAPFEVGQRCWVYMSSSKKGLSKKLAFVTNYHQFIINCVHAIID